MDGVGEHERLRTDVAAVAHLEVLGVEPQVRVVALERPPAERIDLLVERAAERRDPILRHSLDPELLNQPIDLARRDPVHVRLEHDRDDRLLRAPAGLEKRGEVGGALALARDQQLDLPGPRLPRARAVAVAVRRALGRDFAVGGADLGRHLRLHQLAGDDRHRLADEVAVLASEHVGNDIRNSHPCLFGHRGAPLIDSSWNRRVWGPRWPEPSPTPTRPPLHHFYRHDLRRRLDALERSDTAGRAHCCEAPSQPSCARAADAARAREEGPAFCP
ncbi:hypothetical protein BH20ACT14_BH20ACT14_10060 [soil metagenome]